MVKHKKESSMVISWAGRGRNGEFLFSRYKASVMEDKWTLNICRVALILWSTTSYCALKN